MRTAITASLALAGLVGLAGCGGASGPPVQTLSAKTSNLSYSATITVSGKTQCTTTNYRTALPNGQPILQGSHLCGPPAQPGHPVLIQAHGSPQSMLTDVSNTGCGKIDGGRTKATVRLLVTRCTTGQPALRVTILPQERRLVLVGVPGAPVINFPRHTCRTGICVTPLA